MGCEMLLFLLSILITISILLLIILFSDIKLNIKDVEILNFKLNSNCKIELGLFFLGKIKWLNIQLNRGDKKNSERRKKAEEIIKNSVKDIIKDSINSNIELLKNIIQKMVIKKFNLKVDIDTQDIELTAILVGALSALIPNIIRNNVKQNKCFFTVSPIFKETNYIYIKLNSIISIKILHIIYILVNYKKELINKQKLRKGKYDGINNPS